MANQSSLPRTTLGQAGIPARIVQNLLDRFEHDRLTIHSMMIVRRGKVAAECWWKPYSPELPHHIYSFSKSFTATAVGFAIAEGYFSLDDLAADFFGDKIKPIADSRIRLLTVRHLLTMSSGIAVNEVIAASDGDWAEILLNSPMAFDPGSAFHYNSMNSYLLACIVKRTTGLGLCDYLKPRLFDPLGISDFRWETSPDGVEAGGWGLYLRTEDLAKFGLLYTRRGVWNGKQLLPEGWAEEATKAQISNSVTSKGEVDIIDNKAGYGFQFWCCRTPGIFRADGAFAQYAVMWPDKDLVFVVTSGQGPPTRVLDAVWDELITPMLEQDGTADWTEQPGAADDPALQKRFASLSLVPPPSASPRRPELEDRINRRVYRCPHNLVSILPFVIRSIDRTLVRGLRQFDLNFDRERCLFTWKENKDLNSIVIPMDGSFAYSSLLLSEKRYDVASCGRWKDENTFEIEIYFIHTPHKRILNIQFPLGADSAVVTNDELPTLRDSLGFAFDMKMASAPEKLENQALRFCEKIQLPVIAIPRLLASES
ncbi:MAG: serine hydrolase [Firmicutes bacterium]|nr:serine hydrolase [Bacillota bacterium]